MRVTLFSCEPATNESKLHAFKHLASRLRLTAGEDEWALPTNLASSVTHQFQSDGIDIVAIDPPDVRVWSRLGLGLVFEWKFQVTV